jgi:glucose/arabinose dehydrogenase/mono/diheme cytochrome c family protein
MFRTASSFFKSLIIFLISFGFYQCANVPDLPPGDLNNGGLFLPAGFDAVVVVDSLPGRARQIAVNNNGDIYVKSRYGKEGDAALRDTNNDGKADVIEKFGEYKSYGEYGTAMRIQNGYLYFSSELVVYRQKLTPGKLVPESKIEVIVTDDHPHGMHEHIAKPVSFDNKGNMYVPFGAPSNACQEMNRIAYSPGIDPCPLLNDHGGIWRFDANKIGQTQKDGFKFATGLRSIVAMDWNAADENLYVVMHGRDDLRRIWKNIFSPWQSALLPSEEFLKVKEGSDGGWPYCYYDQVNEKKVLAPEYGGDGDSVGRCADYEKPLIGFPGHWAPNDLFFYQGDQFPERYKNGAFIAFHGSTNRAPYPQAGYFVGFVPFINGESTGKWEVFADGFSGVDTIVNTSDAAYRPMGIAMGPDGSLYLSETEKGKIWRVMFKGSKNDFNDANLLKMEERKSLSHIRTPHEINDNLEKGKVVGGEKLYVDYCSACHQGNGKGDAARFPPLAATSWVTGNKTKLIQVILNGLEGSINVNGKTYTGTMPKHNFLSDAEIADVLTYVRQNFGNKASTVTRDEVNAIREKAN